MTAPDCSCAQPYCAFSVGSENENTRLKSVIRICNLCLSLFVCNRVRTEVLNRCVRVEMDYLLSVLDACFSHSLDQLMEY